MEPRVITIGQTDSVLITAAFSGVPRAVRLDLPSRSLAMTRQPDGVYTARVAVSNLLFGYRTGDLHNTAAVFDVTSDDEGTQRHAMTVNVKDGSVATINPQVLAAGTVQSASHVMNIRYDSAYTGGQVPEHVVRTFYRHARDDYDFVAVVSQVHARAAVSYIPLRNLVSGLGVEHFNQAAMAYGSPARLQGLLAFPDDAAFDLAETAVLQELGHRWINYGTLPSLRTVRPHWPISSLAIGVVGSADPVTGNAIIFRFDLTRNTNGTYAVRTTADRPRRFNDFELYLMGLLPPDSVQPHIVFLNQNQRDQLRNGGTLSGPLDTVTVTEWIDQDGERLPSYQNAQRTFSMATIVLSRNRLLTRDELSFFNHMAARGEAEEELSVINGANRGRTLPFFAATGGRGSLETSLLINFLNFTRRAAP